MSWLRILPLVALLAAPAVAIEVLVLRPRSTELVFGEVEVAVKVLSAQPVKEVVVRLDGEVVGRLTGEPYSLVVDAAPWRPWSW